MNYLRVGAVSFKADFGDLEGNLSRIENWVSRLSGQGANLIGFPEMSICGYDNRESIFSLLQPIPGSATVKLLEIASKYRVLVIAGLCTANGMGQHRISQLAISAHGILAMQHKLHLSPKEAKVFTPGDEIAVFDYLGWRIGMQLCYDTHFPEVSTVQALHGAHLSFMSFASAREDSQQAYYERLMRYLPARAYDNSFYVVACNLAGLGGNEQKFPGGSLAFSPKGELIAKSIDGAENYVLVDLSMQSIERLRNRPKAHFISQRNSKLFQKVLYSDSQ